ncbi:PRD domain-containing protein [Yersinia massiliensis]|uniref:PRD domain-containing protein n=1 Tax=Yersinia massiliensis TaxID=419257 RepID=A0AA90XTG8_9GAMM|nr:MULTISPECIES: PRD domain-containing protein [Yersinia]HEC1649495.1 PRD domain-containing protein [Yersinia enterocolitica]MDA5549435.1 PRD domain-containing protein [Yersinia massiliensis]NIL27494.1 PRD domain-containing protein [Yersinia massiliensis]UZM80179.1 PRD domain-containing protein [Yersinia massiliensis]CNL34187.1 protein containing PTS-regulatory domain [Yersinia frederiksenii]
MEICLDPRLNILCQSGVIDADIGQGLDQVIKRLEYFWRLPVHTDQGAMAITHMANALMRTRRGEAINALDPMLLADIIQSEHIHYIREINQDLLAFFSLKPAENEIGYLLTNIYSLYLSSDLPPLR